MKTGIELITEERQRQIEAEAWSSEHDDKHTAGELADAASCYAAQPMDDFHDHETWMPMGWPWESKWWKPSKYRMKDLIKAGALIAAEIDRLQRREYEDGMREAEKETIID